MGGWQNYGPFLGTRNLRCRIKIGTPNGDHDFDNHSRAGPWAAFPLCFGFLGPVVRVEWLAIGFRVLGSFRSGSQSRVSGAGVDGSPQNF